MNPETLMDLKIERGEAKADVEEAVREFLRLPTAQNGYEVVLAMRRFTFASQRVSEAEGRSSC